MDELPSCDGCGACCMQQGHPPYTDEEFAGVPPHLKEPLDAYLAALKDDDTGRPCLWLDLETRRCRNYDHRPQICRDFERGSANCKLVRWHYRIPGYSLDIVPAPLAASTLAQAPFLMSTSTFKPVPSPQLSVVESCDGCGACCMQQGHPPYTNDERELLPYELLAPIDEYLASLEEDDFGQPCIWLDPQTKQCKHYNDRPHVCRDFERGSDMCVQLRLRYRIAAS